MIFVDIYGDLGTQLFQYATAKSLAIDKNSDVMMNLSYFDDKDKSEEFQLNNFNITCNKFKKDDLKNYSNVLTINERTPDKGYVDYIKLNAAENIYLKGEWENERYFRHNSYFIKNDFKFKASPTKENSQIINEIISENSVCLSVSRKNMIDSYSVAQSGLCSTDYYEKSIEFISKIVNNPMFFVFTDDSEWVEDNLKIDYSSRIIACDNSSNDNLEKLQLMTNCKHFILSNSNLCWWGAWLSDYKNKRVFAPTPWFNSFTKQNILCPDWIHINTDKKRFFDESKNVVFELINEHDFEKLDCSNIEKENGKYGIKLNIEKNPANVKLSLNKEIKENEFVMELKLFSLKKGVIHINYGKGKDITVAYRKGYTTRYVHLNKINLNDMNFKFDDDTLSVEHIAIKGIESGLV